MPRRFFRKFAFKRHEFSNRWFMSPLRPLLHDHRLWGIRRQTVVPAFAIGLFLAFMPFPGHMLQAALVALLARVNIPVAALTTLTTNPVTMGPLYYFCYRLGSSILGSETQPFEFEMSLDWVQHTFVSIWQPMLLGCLLVGVLASGIGYFALDVFWRNSVARYKARKRRERSSRPG